MASLLVLLHLLTSQPAGRKRPKKISVSEAADHLVLFQKVCKSHMIFSSILQHFFLVNCLYDDASHCVSGVPEPGGSPYRRAKPPAISFGHRNLKNMGFQLLHSLGWKASSMSVRYIFGCIWWAVQVSLCFQSEIWWCSLQPVHIFADYTVPHWHWHNRRNSKSQRVKSKVVEQAVVCSTS